MTDDPPSCSAGLRPALFSRGRRDARTTRRRRASPEPSEDHLRELAFLAAEAVIGVGDDAQLDVRPGTDRVGEDGHATGHVAETVLVLIAIQDQRRFADRADVTELGAARELHVAQDLEKGKD